MASSRLERLQAKRPYGFCVKMAALAILGLCFIVIWSMFSSSSTFLTYQRNTFSDIGEPVSGRSTVGGSGKNLDRSGGGFGKEKRKVKPESELKVKDEKNGNGSVSVSSAGSHQHKSRNHGKGERSKSKVPEKAHKDETGSEESDAEESREEEEGVVVDGREREEGSDQEGEVSEETERDADLVDSGEREETEEKVEDENIELRSGGKKNKRKGPVFDPNAHYGWKLCSTRSKHNYIPCIDFESSTSKVPTYRHRERSCPRAAPMCLVPLPRDGYGPPVHWPESKLKILHKNVAHPKLDVFIKKHSWVVEYGEYLTFPQNQSEFKGGIVHYLESIEEMVPDIEWGKNIRVVLDIGCSDSSFTASLLDKGVFTLTLGLKDDLVDLAQLALERGFPVVVSPFGTRRLPFPSGVFDAIHCGGCSVSWHSNGGKLLLEMNRILRPAGYFILSSQHDTIEEDEGMTSLTASICWNILAYKTDETSEVGVKIYQKPDANNIYELRRKKIPPLCKENENPDAAWYVPMKNCLHTIPSAIEQRGTEWPEEWPKRLEALPEWLDDKEKLTADTKHWKSIVEKSYFTGMGIDWSNIRNIMDMKAVYGGFAAALSQHKVWVMSVVPVHALDTLPIIYERGLVGVYHDWCESFGTYPRSYDLLHADHLFSRLKNRCKQNVGIVVEMDRILRPGGWAIVRDKVEILDPLEAILRSLHWDIRMTYAQDKEGILCAQKSMWRP